MMKEWARLNALGFVKYVDYLKSPIWQDFKRRYREAGLSVECAACGSKATIHLHHVTYERLGEELLSDVTPLCRSHHDQVHACLNKEQKTVSATAEVIARIREGEQFDTSRLMRKRNRAARPSSKKERNSQTRLDKRKQERERKADKAGFSTSPTAERIELIAELKAFIAKNPTHYIKYQLASLVKYAPDHRIKDVVKNVCRKFKP